MYRSQLRNCGRKKVQKQNCSLATGKFGGLDFSQKQFYQVLLDICTYFSFISNMLHSANKVQFMSFALHVTVQSRKHFKNHSMELCNKIDICCVPTVPAFRNHSLSALSTLLIASYTINPHKWCYTRLGLLLLDHGMSQRFTEQQSVNQSLTCLCLVQHTLINTRKTLVFN